MPSTESQLTNEPERSNQKLYIQTFQAIRSYIAQNHLQPGDFLPPEQTLCQQLGVSRNVLREAIKSLELMGMVEARPRRGTQVKAFSLDFIFQQVLFFQSSDNERFQARELFGIRRMLELAYMRQAFYALSEEDVRLMRACYERIQADWNEAGMFSEADHDFHMALFRPLNNQVLNSLLEAIWAVDVQFELEKKTPHLIASVTKHEAIVIALERYDFRAFAKAMEAHFSSGKYTSFSSYEEA